MITINKKNIISIIAFSLPLISCSFQSEVNNESPKKNTNKSMITQPYCEVKNWDTKFLGNDILPNEYEIIYHLKNTSNVTSTKYILLKQSITNSAGQPIYTSGADEGLNNDVLVLNPLLEPSETREIKRLWKNQKEWATVKLNSCKWLNEQDFISKLEGSSQKSKETIQTPIEKSSKSNRKIEKKINKDFIPALKKIENIVEIPIRIPTFLPWQESSDFFAVIEGYDSKYYKVMLAYTKNCNGGNACRIGTISAEDAQKNTSYNLGEKITLNSNQIGYFTPSQCGATCSDSILRWEENKILYTYSLKAGSQSDLIQMFESSIIADNYPS